MKMRYLGLFTLVLFIVGLSYLRVYGVPNPYIGDNGFCDETHTKDEWVDLFWSNVGSQITYNYYLNTMLPSFRYMAQRVNITTLRWPTMPFVTSAGVLWSDTWGVCAYFYATGFFPNSNLGPDPIETDDDITEWVANTIHEPYPYNEGIWRIVGVDDLSLPYPRDGYIGYVPGNPGSVKIAFIEKSQVANTKVFLHEWGHTPNYNGEGAGYYFWPPVLAVHYGGENGFPAYYYLNIMFRDESDAGEDGDCNWKAAKYPWTNPWYNSFRWDQNY